MPPGTSVHVLTERAFRRESQPFHPTYALRDLNTIARFVQANCGVALLPESSFDHTAHRGVAKTRLHGALSRSVGMFIRRECRPSLLVRQTLDELRRLGAAKQCQAPSQAPCLPAGHWNTAAPGPPARSDRSRHPLCAGGLSHEIGAALRAFLFSLPA
ncbi:hypothetical protein G6F31_018566 [Rhizopus arrhizus]|nr:hypothetical protein G6F31_018566 [Rhizopus arrhizus]